MITEPSSPGRAGIVYSADRRPALWGNPKSNRGKSVERLYAIPPEFAFPARFGDMLVGVLTLPVAFWVAMRG